MARVHIKQCLIQVVLAVVLPGALAFAAIPPDPCTNPFDVSAGDTDGDGVQNACDCAPLDATTFWAPGQLRNLTWDLSSTISWDDISASSGPSVSYDIVRGDLADLRAGIQTSEVCVADDRTVPSFPEPSVPAVGTFWFYLARANNICGAGLFSEISTHSACSTPATSRPAVVSGVEAEILGADILISWLPVPGATDYAIYEMGPSATERHGDCLVSGLTTTTYTHVGVFTGSLPEGRSYYVVARNAFGESPLGSTGLGFQEFRSGPPCP